MKTRQERYWEEQEKKKLCRGLKAIFENNTLSITKDGEPFENFTIGATTDWMSGSFSLYHQVVYSWDGGRRKKRNKTDRWSYHGKVICDMINYYANQ